MGINLNIPYYSQRDNEFAPHQTCNVTSVAMCLTYFGIKPKLKPQLEDELYLKVQTQGWDRYTHSDLDKLFHLYGVDNTFDTDVPWEKVKAHLKSNNPVIMSGRFTRSGHIIVLRGYDETGFFVNDPWGEWFADGYKNKSGNNLHYSYKLCNNISYGGSKTTWAHLPKRRAIAAYGDLPACGVELIKEFEGCSLIAYPDPITGDEPITIAWGSTEKPNGEPWEMHDEITQEDADKLLITQLRTNYFPQLAATIPNWDKFNVNQKGALLSFAYNLGANFFKASGFDSISAMLMLKPSTLTPQTVRDTFVKYCNPGSSAEAGLKRRRLAEAELFNKAVV